MSAVISVRVNDEERELLAQMADRYGCGISSLMKQLAFEKLEDEYDMKVVREYETAREEGTLKVRPAEELWAELGL